MKAGQYCEEFAELISRMLDDDLDQSEQIRLWMHLDHCEGCRSYYEAQCAIRSQMQNLPVELPVDFTASVMERIAQDVPTVPTTEPKDEEPKTVERSKKTEQRILFLRYRVIPLVACCALLLLSVQIEGLPSQGKGSRQMTANTLTESAMVEESLYAEAPMQFACTENEAEKEFADAVLVPTLSTDALPFLTDCEEATIEPAEDGSYYTLDQAQCEALLLWLTEQGLTEDATALQEALPLTEDALTLLILTD